MEETEDREEIIERVAALDIGKAEVVVCVRVPDRVTARPTELVASYGTTTPDLLELKDWLAGLGVTEVAMESTGVYWKPVYYVLEDDFRVVLVNAAHVKHVPGRKTDLLTELPDRSFERCARRSARCWLGSVLVINDGRAVVVLRVGGAAARLA